MAAESPMPTAEQQAHFMDLTLAEAAKCVPSPTAFSVGAVIVTVAAASDSSDSDSSTTTAPWQLLSTGYSRELEGNTHAEQCALDKLYAEYASRGEQDEVKQLLRQADMYTSMEPCSVRLSGNVACTARILESGLRRVFLGTMEPDEFVTCEGVAILQKHGVEVHQVDGFKERCLQAARRGH